MGLFRKRRQDEDVDVQDESVASGAEDDATDEGDEQAEEAGAAARTVVPVVPPTGPWDEADLDDSDEVQRLDLGALRLPVVGDVEVRLDLNEAGGVVAGTLAKDGSGAQVSVFAAPRSEGIWDEVREEIRASVEQSGGQATDATGPWGPELLAVVPTQTPQGVVGAELRFVGVNGPRWFLRALVTGPAARDAAAAAPLEEALRKVVVVRGGDPMAVREALPLTLPPEAVAAREAQIAEQAAQQGIQLPERGPEITEVR